ncbi:MAG: hypothetical protein V1872_02010 [bacterium]
MLLKGKEVGSKNRTRSVLKVPFYVFMFFCFCHFLLNCNQKVVEAADKENCQLCHRYSGLGNFDETTARKKIYYVNEHIYRNTVHGEVRCSHCHADVTEIPHKPAKPVNCGAKCHMKEPSTGKDFSHAVVVKDFFNGEHGKNKLFLGPEGQPKCKYCHQNPVYQSLRGILSNRPTLRNESLTRCLGCHEENKWTERFLKHFTSRTAARWDNKGIVELCTSCHDDTEMMSRYGTESTKRFRDTFHWRNIKYEAKDAANCITCHAPSALKYAKHDIRKAEDPLSPISLANGMQNRIATCGQTNCHSSPTSSFVTGSIHSYAGGRTKLLKDSLTKGDTKLSEEQQEKVDIELKDVRMDELRLQIVSYIKLLYMCLIPLVVGSMIFHQVLDFITTLKERSEGGHH